MRIRRNSAIVAVDPHFFLLCLIFLTCLVSKVNASRHRHQQHQSESSVSTSSGSSSKSAEITHQTGKRTLTKLEKLVDPQLDLLKAEIDGNTSPKKNPDFLREYMSRSMFQCSATYVGTLSKLHALIKVAYDEYKACQEVMQNTKKAYKGTGLEAIDELFGEWKEEDETEGSEDSSEEDLSVFDLPPRPLSHH